MNRTVEYGLYKDFPQEFNGTLNYHVDSSLSVGGFVGIWIIYYFFGFCFTSVLAIVVKRSSKGNALGPGVQLIIFNIGADMFTQLVNIIFLSFTGGDWAIFPVAGLAVVAWFVHVSAVIQINSVIAMFHLRRKVMQDVEELVSDQVYNAKKYIMVGIGAAVGSQTIILGAMAPNWLFNQKWYVNGEIDSVAKRALIATTISPSGYDNVVYDILGGVNIAVAFVIPTLYCFYCLVPVLRLLRKLRKKGICSAEMQSMARLSITFYLIFVFFFMSQVLIGVVQSSFGLGVNGRGLTWVVASSLGVMNTTANGLACYIFFPRFRAFGMALMYDLLGRRDRAREAENLVEKELDDYDRTILTENGTTDSMNIPPTTEMTSESLERALTV